MTIPTQPQNVDPEYMISCEYTAREIVFLMKMKGCLYTTETIISRANRYILDKTMSLMDCLTIWENEILNGYIPQMLRCQEE